MVNSAEGPAKLIDALGAQRVLLGFPGAGGTLVDDVVRYTIVHPAIQLTTLGEAHGGRATERVISLVEAFRGAGRPTPGRLGLLRFTPTGLMAMIAGTLLDTDYADLVVARHANNARDEMRRLAEQISIIANDSGVDTPSADALAAYL